MNLSTIWLTTAFSHPHEKRGYFVGITEHVGHTMTFKVLLTDDTKEIINRSNILLALDPKSCNLCLDPLNNIQSRHDSLDHGEGLCRLLIHMISFNAHFLFHNRKIVSGAEHTVNSQCTVNVAMHMHILVECDFFWMLVEKASYNIRK
jgi:hypothetical protein